MSKDRGMKKSEKKAPQKTMKEKKTAKRAKKMNKDKSVFPEQKIS